VVVDLVDVAEARSHLPQLELRPPRQRQEREVGLGQRHAGLGARLLLAGLDPYLRPRVGIDLPEQAQFHLAREETVLAAGERPGVGLVDVVLREVGDEIAGEADVEQQLAAAALAVEREGLARAGEVDQAWRRGRRGGGPASVRFLPGPARLVASRRAPAATRAA
jgi:hypothetical protein